MRKTLIGSLLLFLFASTANAVPVTCVSASGLPCVANAGDVLAGPVVVPNSGNDFENLVEAAILTATGVAVDLTLYGKSDDDPQLFSFSNFDEGASLEQSKSGDWSVLDGTLISYFTVKAANSFAVYLVSPAASSGSYTTEGILNNGGQQPDVSHISFWTTDGNTPIPEPTSMLLFGLGAAGMLLRKRSA